MIELDIPSDLQVHSLEFSMVVSNLLENAIAACLKQSDSTLLYIHFYCRNVGRLLLEMENPYAQDTSLDESGYPVTPVEGHGLGSKSVITFARKYDGELMYQITHGVFRVRLLV